MLALDHVHLLSPQAQIAFYLDKAAHYQKLAKDARADSVRDTLEAVARDFADRAKSVKAKGQAA
jgi:hypothetical protein